MAVWLGGGREAAGEAAAAEMWPNWARRRRASGAPVVLRVIQPKYASSELTWSALRQAELS